MRGLLPHPLLSAALVLTWLLLANKVSTGQLLLGLLLGWSIPLATRRFWPERVCIRRPLALARYLGVLVYDILLASMNVARLVLGPPRRLRPAFLVLPLRLRSDLAISLLANTICLTPGTVAARLSRDRRALLIHALDAEDPRALAETIRGRYENPLLEIFESC
jgi:multicomponent K+:H+ antiporter subunit E